MTIRKNETDRIVDCDLCGNRPAYVCLFQSVQGRIVYYNKREYVGHLCGVCIRKVYADYTFDTFIEGWWSIYGFIRTPYVIVINTVELVSCQIKLRHLSRTMRG